MLLYDASLLLDFCGDAIEASTETFVIALFLVDFFGRETREVALGHLLDGIHAELFAEIFGKIVENLGDVVDFAATCGIEFVGECFEQVVRTCAAGVVNRIGVALIAFGEHIKKRLGGVKWFTMAKRFVEFAACVEAAE